jgi:hypothetical protein
MADLFASLQSTVAGILSYETHACRDVFEGGVSGHGRPVISIDTVPEERSGVELILWLPFLRLGLCD